jgi:murein DD-endopeptidase MepM/ murein hydrolase activator NlpD
MTTGQVLGVVGMTGSAATALMVQLMRGRSEDITNGAFVREQLQYAQIPDTWGQFLVQNGNATRGWGMRTTSDGRRRPHGGQDICGPQGSIIHAMRSGLVEFSGQVNGYGECILLRHSDGSTSLYAHLNDRGVEQGMLVQGGSPIATMGRTSSTGRKPADRDQQGSANDPRCQRFRNMGIHLHFSTHGHGERKLPHRLTFRQTVGSDNEWNYGTDPMPFLGSKGVRIAAASPGACPTWSRSWYA